MKKLNITKKQYDESKYFNNKYGSIKFVSESGKLFKTNKGVVLALEGTEPTDQENESLSDIGNAIKKTAGEVGDKVKAGVGKAKDAVKTGVKKVGRSIGDAIHGMYRKNDRVTISGKAGDMDGAVISATPERVVIRPDNEREFDESIDDLEGADEETINKEEVSAALADVVDTIKAIADDNELEVPGLTADEDDDDDEELEELEECDCKGKACECKTESAKRRARAKLVREAIAKKARIRKIKESIARRAKVRKMMESRKARRAK